MGQNKPQLKKCFKNKEHALEVFNKEMLANRDELKKHGLFFSFTTDPMLPETIDLTKEAAELCLTEDIPVKILTKRTDWINDFSHDLVIHDRLFSLDYSKKYLLAIGFTLTGHDELEPGASTNAERVKAMDWLNSEGIRTFASIEPIIDLASSLAMIEATADFCDLFKIGLESGKKYNKKEVLSFYEAVNREVDDTGFGGVYWKDSLLKLIDIDRKTCMEAYDHCVNRGFDIFKLINQ